MADLRTTIAIAPETKAALEALKIHPRETYDEVVRRILFVKVSERREAQERRAG